MKIIGQLIEIGGGLKGSTAHVATFEIGSLEEIRALAEHLYTDVCLFTDARVPRGETVEVNKESLRAIAIQRETVQQDRDHRPYEVNMVYCLLCGSENFDNHGDRPPETHLVRCALYE